MAIVDGFTKVKNYILTSSGYKLLSRWTHAGTVECTDGETVQTKIGNVKGITSSLNTTDTGFLLDATAGAKLNSDLDKKVTTGQVGRVTGITIGDENSKNYIYQDTDGTMRIRYVDSSGNISYTNFSELKKSVADGKNTLLSTVSKYWAEAGNWDANGVDGKPIPSWGNLSDMITFVYNNGVGSGRPAEIKMEFFGGQSEAGCHREEVYRLFVPKGYNTITVQGNTTLCGYGSTIPIELLGYTAGSGTGVKIATWTAPAGNYPHFSGSYNISAYQGGFIDLHRGAAHAATGSYHGYMTLN